MLGRIQFSLVMAAVIAALGAYVVMLRNDVRSTEEDLQAARLAVSVYVEAADVMVAQVDALRAAKAASDKAYADRLAGVRAAEGVCVDEALPDSLLD